MWEVYESPEEKRARLRSEQGLPEPSTRPRPTPRRHDGVVGGFSPQSRRRRNRRFSNIVLGIVGGVVVVTMVNQGSDDGVDVEPVQPDRQGWYNCIANSTYDETNASVVVELCDNLHGRPPGLEDLPDDLVDDPADDPSIDPAGPAGP